MSISVMYFRPISLIGIQYKIIAKILANRLAKVIDKIISKEQSAFIAGRQILDGPLILTEIIKWYKIRKKKFLIFKVDFEKAFDSISWKFFDHILVKLGFGQKWCSWIKACLISSRVSILVNGSLTSEFFINRGLRQGDPLSPFLFILFMEGLHNNLADAVTKGLISGVNLNSSNINISYLFYANDVIINSKRNARELENIIRVLHVFYLASGLKINIHKSNIYGIRVNDEDVSSMAHNVGCISGALPFTYLGLPIGSNMNSIASWKMVIDRFQSRLSSWKANLLSFAFHGQEGGFDSYGCKFKGTWANIVADPEFDIGKTYGWVRRPFVIDIIDFIVWTSTKIASLKTIKNGNWNWNWSRTNLGSRNIFYFRDMLNEIGDVNIEVAEDTCYWSLGSNGIYTVKEARQIIDLKTLPSLDLQSTWDKVLPRKLNIFLWRMSLDHLPHRLNLSSRVKITFDLNEPKDSSKNDKAVQNGRTPKSLTLEIHHGGCFTSIPSRSYVGGQVRLKQGSDICTFIHKKLGNGANTSLWEDVWRGNVVFKYRFPRLYALESHKRIDVAARLAHSSVAYSFRRAPRSGVEQSQLADLLTMIEGVSLVSMNDMWVWSLEGSGNFSVASVRKLIDDRRLPDVSSKTRWIKAVPIKVNVHAWKVRLDSLPTRLNISRRDLFRKINRWWDLSYIEVSSFDECFHKDKWVKKLFHAVFFTVNWHIWNWRNKISHPSSLDDMIV
nr:RNA-directed DNA polymerase, eukaryota, reverse transcriptase zinc-binding domain protein [Tanacetum cinerariifolium]